ncbi:MAG: replication initiation protein [Spiroplasma ixodetis]|nr:replication initiation protein [Spiroplasma ixodetis]MBP1526799.1 replication initiation protein [Spiroplasma ixodetis]MBP1528011.1 replication initiation protein [Spiroplasma ixodetis]
MPKSLKKKVDNKFIKKSNVIVRAVTNECAGIMTQRLFNFAILSIKKDYKEFNGKIKFWLKDFCDYFEINSHTIYDTIIHRKKEITVIMKELDNLTSLKFLLFDEKTGNFKFVNLFLEGGLNNGYVELKVNKDLTTKYYLDLKKDYTNVYLPYTKTVTSKYSLRLYEYLRSYLYINAKTKKMPNFKHEWDFEQLSKILNLSLNCNYFKRINNLKSKILESVKKDLAKTDIIFTYELIKVGRKYNKIILNTHLDLEKFNAQNPELEKVPTKKEYKVYADKSKLTANDFTESGSKPKSKIIEKTILTDKQLQNILKNIDND